MVRYAYSLSPLLLVWTLCILALPWLGLVALLFVALIVVRALVWTVLLAQYAFGVAIHEPTFQEEPVS